MQQLFRKEALDAVDRSWRGSAILDTPRVYQALVLAVGLLLAGILVVFIKGGYSKHITVSGQLVPDTGLLKVRSPQPGLIVQKLVSEGQLVRSGQPLFVISMERKAETNEGVQAAIKAHIEGRARSIHEQIEQVLLRQGIEKQSQEKTIVGLTAEIRAVTDQIETQEQRIQLAVQVAARYKELVREGFVSQEQLRQKTSELLDQRDRSESLQRERANFESQVEIAKLALASLYLRQQSELAALRRDAASVAQEITESEAKRRLLVIAPAEGTASVVAGQVGQTVDETHPLASIVPTGAILEAHLYVPSRAVGFIKVGNSVRLRYHAFPFQKFGVANAAVKSIATSAVPRAELSEFYPMSSPEQSDEPVYRIILQLKAQSVVAYGKAHSLRPGMQLDADILQERRPLYQWALDPLISLTGKL